MIPNSGNDEKIILDNAEISEDNQKTPAKGVSPAFFEITRELNDKVVELMEKRPNSCRAHYHGHLEIFILHKGEQRITINNETCVLHENQMSVSDSYEIHSYEPTPGTISSVLIIPLCFLADYAIYKYNRKLGGHFILDEEVVLKCAPLIDKIGKEHNNLILRGYINQLLGIISNHLKLVKAEIKHKYDTDFVRLVLEYISTHITEDINRDSLAAAFGFGPAYFARKFNNLFGCNLSEYLSNARLNKFLELHRQNPTIPYYILAQNAGFNSSITFYRTFKKKMGKSPREYFNLPE